MGKAGVISFREDCTVEREIRNQEVLIVEKTKKDGVNLLATEMEKIPTVDWQLVKDTENISEVVMPIDSTKNQDSDSVIDNEELGENNELGENKDRTELVQKSLTVSDIEKKIIFAY